jgi:hypothetical protein
MMDVAVVRAIGRLWDVYYNKPFVLFARFFDCEDFDARMLRGKHFRYGRAKQIIRPL